MRLRSNFQKGTLTNSPGGAGTSFQSAEFAALPVVASPDTLTLVLDPLEETGAPEVLTVTAHTSASTTCTVTRAQDGSAARTAAAGMRWIATPTRQDWIPDPPLLMKGKNAVQSIAAATAVSLVFETTDLNLGGFDVVSTSLWSPPLDGIYEVNAAVAFQGAGTTIAEIDRRIVTVYNSTDATNLNPQASAPAIPATINTIVVLTAFYELFAAKDYAIRGRQDHTAARDVDVDSRFSVLYVRPSS